MTRSRWKDFFLEIRNDSDTSPVHSRISLLSLYLITLVTQVVGTWGIFNSLADGVPGEALVTGLFMVFTILGVVFFLLTRRIEVYRGFMTLGVFILGASMVLTAGGPRGFGFLYFVAAFPVLYLVMGLRFGILFPLALVGGATIKITLGPLPGTSVFQDPILTINYLIPLLMAAVLGVISVVYLHSLVIHLSRMAYRDPVTGLYNREKVQEFLDEIIKRSQQKSEFWGFLGLRIKDFDRVNATLGNAEADRILKELGSRLTETSGPGVLVARFSGTMLLVLWPAKTPGDVKLLARKVNESLSQPVEVTSASLSLSFETAATLYPRDGLTREELLSNLQSVFNQHDGGPEVNFYNENLSKEERRRYLLGEDLKHSLERQENFLVYHPKIRLGDGVCTGAEILLRWKSATFGVVGPDIFIPLAEQSGYIHTLTRWVIRQTFDEIARFKSKNPQWGQLAFAINLSPLDLAAEDLPAYLSREMTRTGVRPENLELEITEGVLVEKNTGVKKVLDILRNMGLRLAIDDFGTGYSSLSYLQRFHVNNLKIDQSFIRPLGQSQDDFRIVEAFTSIGQSLETEITAEGVETKEQAERLKTAGCTYAQGWFYAKPLPASDFDLWLQEWSAQHPQKG